MMRFGDARQTNQRYILVLLLFLHTVNTYMDRVCISAAGKSIQRDLGISDQTMGYVFGIFAVGYALFQIPAGWLADTLGARKALSLVVLFWSAFTALTGAAVNAASLLVVRFLFGAGEAGAFPGATRALYQWLPVKERGLAQGIFHSGARVGAAGSLFVMPFLISWIGWRWTFVANGVIGIVWGAVWFRWFRDDPAEHHRVGRRELDHIRAGLADDFVEKKKIPLIQIVTSANMLLAMFQYVASNVTFFISFTWLLPYLEDRWGEEAVLLAPVPLIFGAVAQWTSGSLVNYLYSRGYDVGSRRYPAAAGFVLGAVGLLLISTVAPDSPGAFVFCFSIAVFGVEMTISPSWAFCMDIGGERSGSVSGSMNMLGNLGAAMSAVLFPYFVDHVTLPYVAATTGTADSFFAFAAALNILGAVAWLFMNPKRKLSREVTPAMIRARLLVFGCLVAVVVLALLYTNFILE
jgi:ACS family glucarate transporter-like MFS transporter